MKALNVRLLAILLACGLVLATLVCGIPGLFGGLHDFQVRRNAYVFLREAERARERAKEAEEAGNDAKAWGEYRTAMRHYGWYVKLKPDDTDKLEEFGLLLAEKAHDSLTLSHASDALERVLRQDPKRTKARRKLVDVAMTMRLWSDAREHLEDYLLVESPDDGELLELLGTCQAAVREDELAVESYKRAIQKMPERVETYPLLALMLRYRMNRPQEADEWMEKLVESNPDSHMAHLSLGRYLRNIGSLDDAMAHALEALKLKPDDGDALRLAAQCALGRDDYEEARGYAQHGIKLYPDDVSMYTTIAEIEVQAGQLDQAVAALRQGLKPTGEHPRLLLSLADLLIETDALEEAQQIVEKLRETIEMLSYRERRGYEAVYPYFPARIKYEQGDWLSASQAFEKARGGLSNSDYFLRRADFCLAECYKRLGNRDQQLRVLLGILDRDPLFAPALAGVAEAKLATGQVDDALQMYQRLVRTGKAPEGAYFTLVRILILKNLQLKPAQRKWGEVEQVLAQAAEAMPDSVQVPILHAEALVAQGRMPEAEALLLAAREKAPEVVGFWTALASLAQQRKEWDKVEELFGEAEKKLGDQVSLRLARAQYLARRHGKDATEEVRKLAEKHEQFSEAQRRQLFNGLLSIALQMGDDEQSKLLCQRVAQAEPNNLRIRFQLFEIAIRSKDEALISEMLNEMERIGGRGVHWLYGEAVRLSLQGSEGRPELLAQALKYVTQARELHPSWSRLPELAAGIYDKQGNRELALANYLQAIEMGDRNFVAIRRAAELLTQGRQFAKAREVIGLLEGRETPFSYEIDQLKAKLDLQQGRLDQALDTLRKIAADSENFGDYILLGQALSVKGQRAKADGQVPEAEKMLAEAEQALRRAVELSDEVAETWVVLVQFYANTEQTQKALDAMGQARSKIPADQAPLAMAQCFEALGHLDQARDKYGAALAAAVDDPVVVRQVAEFYLRTGEKIRAEALLKRIIDGKVKGEQADVIWARRRLAWVLVTRRGYQNLQKAIQLIEENILEAGPSAQDLRLIAKMRASHPARSQHQLAMQMLENLLTGQQLANPEDRFVLAQLYLAEGAWIKASEQFQSLLASHGDEPRYVSTYVGALLDHDELVNAETWLKRLEEIAPNQFTTTNLKARLLFERERYDEAFELVTGFAENPSAQPSDEAERTRRGASLLETFAQQLKAAGKEAQAKRFALEAELLYQKYVRLRPGHEMVLAAFLGRQDRIAEALSLVERSWSDTNAFAIAQTCIILVRSPAATEAQVQQTEAIAQAAMKKFDDSLPLLLVIADIRSTQERYREAEACYREILRKSSGDAVAMNNLGVLLALQKIKLEEALRLINEAIGIAGPVASMLDSRASVHMALGRPDKALVDLKAALNEGDSAIRRFHQAQAYLQAGQKNDAQEALETAYKLGLKPEMIQPIERKAYQKLLEALK